MSLFMCHTRSPVIDSGLSRFQFLYVVVLRWVARSVWFKIGAAAVRWVSISVGFGVRF